jgi:hypothetical protein
MDTASRTVISAASGTSARRADAGSVRLGARDEARRPESVLGSASNACGVSSSSMRLRRTVTVSASSSTSWGSRPRTSPRYKPHQATNKIAARYRG